MLTTTDVGNVTQGFRITECYQVLLGRGGSFLFAPVQNPYEMLVKEVYLLHEQHPDPLTQYPNSMSQSHVIRILSPQSSISRVWAGMLHIVAAVLSVVARGLCGMLT